MKFPPLKYKLLLGAFLISLVMTSTSMIAVSVVISRQYHDQSRALLERARKIITDNLNDRKVMMMDASKQLADQKNLGSTIWYLGQYAELDTNRDILFNTYQQLVTDINRIGRVAKLTQIAIYDGKGNLLAFSSFKSNLAGFVDRSHILASPVKTGEELIQKDLQKTDSIPGLSMKLNPAQPDGVQYAVVGNSLAIKDIVPIMGETLDPASGNTQTGRLGTIEMVQSLDRDFVDYIGRLTDIRINLFTASGYSSGNLPAYRKPDWTGASRSSSASNTISIGDERFQQILIPLYTGDHLVGTIAALQSDATVHGNILEMVRILFMISLASLLIVFPLAWYLANSISRPLTLLSKIFKDVASGKQTLGQELDLMREHRGDELGELTGSFISMNNAIHQKIAEINEINATLEDKIEERTRQLQDANDALTRLAKHDALTGLPNRQLLSDRIAQALASARREKSHVSLMFIDLDEFKPINDIHGHAIGDLLLIEAAKRIHDSIRESDTVSRLGGDEFIVLLPSVESEQQAAIVADKIRHMLCQPFDSPAGKLSISCSIGVSMYPEHGLDEDTLLKNADFAMYDAKRSGRNAVRLYHPGTDQTRLEF